MGLKTEVQKLVKEGKIKEENKIKGEKLNPSFLR